jgi:hypothetical protein
MSLPPPALETPGAEELDATTGEVLEPDEAPTPAWLPLVGLGVVFIALLALLTARPAGTNTHESAPARASVVAEPSADPVAPAAAAGRARPPVPTQPTPPSPGCAE